MFSYIFDVLTNFFTFLNIGLMETKGYLLDSHQVSNYNHLGFFSKTLYVLCDAFHNLLEWSSDTVVAKTLYELELKHLDTFNLTKEEYVEKYLNDLKEEEEELKMSNLCRRYGFPKPLNPHMECVILMYHENCTVMFKILIGIILYIIVALFLFTSRSLKDVQKTSKQVEYLIDLGFIWIPTAIIFNLAGMAVGYILHLDFIGANLKTSITVEVMGHQWYWWYTLDADVVADQFKFLNSYLFNEFMNNHLLMTRRRDVEVELRQFLPLEEIRDGNFLAVNLPMVLPAKEHVRFFISSKDVIHSWTIPQLGVKVDALPGRINQFFVYSYFTGMYFGMCSELCGVFHAFMPICIEFQRGSIFFLFCMFYRNGNIVDPKFLKKQFETAITLE